MDTNCSDLLKAFEDFWQTWARRDLPANTIEKVTAFFNEDITAIGTGEHERGRHYEEVVQNFQDDFQELMLPIYLNFFRKNARLLSPSVGLVEAEAKLEIKMEDGEVLHFHIRFSTLFTYCGKRWKISHNHVSMPSDGQNVGESYPLDQLKAKNAHLKRLVTERTQALEEKTAQLEMQKEKTEELLHNILPRIVAEELLETGKVQPSGFDQVSVLFSDFVGFTKVASQILPNELVAELNDIFFHFDDIIKSEKMEKIKTIGDCYMAVCGLPEEEEQHALRCVNAAKKMLLFLQQRNASHKIQWQMRIGIHSGSVVAGVVGKHKFTYDLWGHTVNVASRLESAGKPGHINISQQTYTEIAHRVPCNYRGKIEVKGGQEIEMYFVQ